MLYVYTLTHSDIYRRVPSPGMRMSVSKARGSIEGSVREAHGVGRLGLCYRHHYRPRGRHQSEPERAVGSSLQTKHLPSQRMYPYNTITNTSTCYNNGKLDHILFSLILSQSLCVYLSLTLSLSVYLSLFAHSCPFSLYSLFSISVSLCLLFLNVCCLNVSKDGPASASCSVVLSGLSLCYHVQCRACRLRVIIVTARSPGESPSKFRRRRRRLSACLHVSLSLFLCLCFLSFDVLDLLKGISY